jgi:hypothetical protein
VEHKDTDTDDEGGQDSEEHVHQNLPHVVDLNILEKYNSIDLLVFILIQEVFYN